MQNMLIVYVIIYLFQLRASRLVVCQFSLVCKDLGTCLYDFCRALLFFQYHMGFDSFLWKTLESLLWKDTKLHTLLLNTNQQKIATI